MGTLKLKKPSSRELKIPRERREGRTMDLPEFRRALEARGLVLKAPFQVRIDRAIRDRTGLPWAQIGRNLARLVNRRSYHQSVLDSEYRYDLDGKPAERVEEKHKERAREMLARAEKSES